MTTDGDSECSYVANLADFNIMRVIVIVIKIVYNSKKSNNSSIVTVIIVYNSKKSNNSESNNYSKKSNNSSIVTVIIVIK